MIEVSPKAYAVARILEDFVAMPDRARAALLTVQGSFEAGEVLISLCMRIASLYSLSGPGMVLVRQLAPEFYELISEHDGDRAVALLDTVLGYTVVGDKEAALLAVAQCEPDSARVMHAITKAAGMVHEGRH